MHVSFKGHHYGGKKRKTERDFFHDIDKLTKGFMMEEHVMWFNYTTFWYTNTAPNHRKIPHLAIEQNHSL